MGKAQGLLTWAGRVSTDWLARDLFTAHLSQLQKQKDTMRKPGVPCPPVAEFSRASCASSGHAEKCWVEAKMPGPWSG